MSNRWISDLRAQLTWAVTEIRAGHVPIMRLLGCCTLGAIDNTPGPVSDIVVVMAYARIRKHLDKDATQIWEEVTTARLHHAKYAFGEVGVTERLHLHLHPLISGMTYAIDYEQTDESLSGADWEWVIQIPGPTKSYVHYRIQAKILARPPRGASARRLQFKEINHKNAKSLQRRLLIDEANKIGAYPFYCFYIGDPWSPASKISIPSWAPPLKQPPRKQFGAAVVPAEVVDSVAKTAKTVTDANQYLTKGDPKKQADPRVGLGRRLSDLFPGSVYFDLCPPSPMPGGSPGGSTPGGSTPGASSSGDGSGSGSSSGSSGEDASDSTGARPLAEAYMEEINQIRGLPPLDRVFESDRRDENRPRLTAYFLLEE